jgi:hypothetical protein
MIRKKNKKALVAPLVQSTIFNSYKFVRFSTKRHWPLPDYSFFLEKAGKTQLWFFTYKSCSKCVLVSYFPYFKKVANIVLRKVEGSYLELLCYVDCRERDYIVAGDLIAMPRMVELNSHQISIRVF